MNPGSLMYEQELGPGVRKELLLLPPPKQGTELLGEGLRQRLTL